MCGCEAGVSCRVTGYISGPHVFLCHGEFGQAASETLSFPGRECDILMILDSGQLRKFSFAMRYVGVLDPETKGTGRSVVYYKCGLDMCLTKRSMVNSRQDLVGVQTSEGRKNCLY